MLTEVRQAMSYARQQIKDFKSANKHNKNWDDSRIERYLTAIEVIDREIRDSANPLRGDTFKDLKKILKLAQLASEKKAGNCGEASAIAFAELLKIEAIRPIEIIHAQKDWADHAFVLVGRKSTVPFNQPKKWTEGMFVADPWANIACPAKQYVEQWKDKMGKWAAQGKNIVPDPLSSGKLKEPKTRSPIEKDWIELIEASIQTSYARQEVSSKTCSVM